MIEDHLFGSTRIPLLVKGMNTYALRHRAISENVVNSETPGYQRREIVFEDKLRAVLGKGRLELTSPRHIGQGGVRGMDVEPEARIDTKPSDVNDLNNVDIDVEMGAMAQNHLQFNFASKLTRDLFQLIQASIKGL